MATLLKEVKDKRTLRQYIYLPRQLYRGFQNWVPPIYAEEWKFHDQSYNPALAYSDTVRMIAYENGKAVGRIMGIINKKYNEQHGEATARFFNFDCINEVRVAHALLSFIEQWASDKGSNRLIGPFGFSDKDPQGLQIEGFDHLAVIAAPSNPPYLQRLVETEGYAKLLDCVSYKLPVSHEASARYEKVYRRVLDKHKLELVEFRNKRQLRPYVLPALQLINEAYAPLFGFIPMTEPEMKRLVSQYMPILNPAFMKSVKTREGEMAGFIIALPDMSRGIQKARGQLFPFGFLYMLGAAKTTRQLDVVLGAVKQKYRGIGVDVLLGRALMQTAVDRGFESMDTHLVLETNARMRGEYEKRGGVIYKRFRVFGKSLTNS